MLDSRLKLANADKERRCILLAEVDRGTETNIEAFKQKIRAYVHYALPGGAFEEQFGRANKRVVWIVTKGGENRLWTLRKWCEEELAIDPYTFFLTPVAYLPYHKEPDTLLWKP